MLVRSVSRRIPEKWKYAANTSKYVYHYYITTQVTIRNVQFPSNTTFISPTQTTYCVSDGGYTISFPTQDSEKGYLQCRSRRYHRSSRANVNIRSNTSM